MSSCQQLFDDLEKQEVHVFPSEPAVRRELRDVPMLGAKGTAGGHEEQLESVWVNGRELKRDSRVKDLQDGCNFLGINPSCSKSKLYDRLCSRTCRSWSWDLSRLYRRKEWRNQLIQERLKDTRQQIFLSLPGVTLA